jgi:hypothetical protein
VIVRFLALGAVLLAALWLVGRVTGDSVLVVVIALGCGYWGRRLRRSDG